MDYQAIRKEYENHGIKASDLSECPFESLSKWVKLATDKSPGRWFESNAMSLATTDLEGNVSVRMVLLKGITDVGIRFFTNYDSRKGTQLAANPIAAVCFHWPYLGRQLRIEGSVEKTSREVSEEYFHSRPRGSQIGAYVSKQSTKIDARETLDEESKKFEASLDGNPVPLPENWGGYLLLPTRFEFWQGRLDRLHDRIVYERENKKWCRHQLAP